MSKKVPDDKVKLPKSNYRRHLEGLTWAGLFCIFPHLFAEWLSDVLILRSLFFIMGITATGYILYTDCGNWQDISAILLSLRNLSVIYLILIILAFLAYFLTRRKP